MSQGTTTPSQEVQQNGSASAPARVSDLSPDEFKALVRDSVAGLPDATGVAVASALEQRSTTSTVTGTVALDGSQWSTLSRFVGADLRVSVFGVAFLALLLGAVVGVALTFHWRGGRG